jgi:hypothetical protein
MKKNGGEEYIIYWQEDHPRFPRAVLFLLFEHRFGQIQARTIKDEIPMGTNAVCFAAQLTSKQPSGEW